MRNAMFKWKLQYRLISRNQVHAGLCAPGLKDSKLSIPREITCWLISLPFLPEINTCVCVDFDLAP